jgi:hypothetical protein
MAHFAKLDTTNTVLEVVVVNNLDAPTEAAGIAFLNSLFGAANWKQTSYNNSTRKQYAGVGYKYDPVADVFISPQPFPSWTIDANHDWKPPVPMPNDGLVHSWNEATLSWI